MLIVVMILHRPDSKRRKVIKFGNVILSNPNIFKLSLLKLLRKAVNKIMNLSEEEDDSFVAVSISVTVSVSLLFLFFLSESSDFSIFLYSSDCFDFFAPWSLEPESNNGSEVFATKLKFNEYAYL